MSNRMGLNIQASGLAEAYVMQLCSGGASTYLIMNDVGMAQRAHDNTGACIISRADWPDDESGVPGDLVPKWRARQATAPDVYHYWPNEPEQADLDAYIQLMDDCANAGLKACIGNFAWPKSIANFDDVKGGKWDKFLLHASQWTHGGYGLIGGHDYTTGALPWGAGGMNPEDMITGSPGLPDGRLIGPESWPTFQDMWDHAYSDWHNFRWVALARRCADLNIEFPKMVLTECFWDRMEDLENDGILAKMDALRPGGKPQGRDGLNTQKAWFKRWWPDWTTDQAIIEQLKWCECTYSPHIVGFCMFAVNRGSKWVNYNLEGVPEVLKALPTIPGGKHLAP